MAVIPALWWKEYVPEVDEFDLEKLNVKIRTLENVAVYTRILPLIDRR